MYCGQGIFFEGFWVNQTHQFLFSYICSILISMTVLHYSPKVFIFSNQPESSNLSSVSLYPDRTSPPHPPPLPPPSLWWVQDTEHMEKGVRVFFPATEWIWHMMIGGTALPLSEGGIHFSPSSVLLNMRMALEILRAGPSLMLMIFTMSVWVSSRKASPSII